MNVAWGSGTTVPIRVSSGNWIDDRRIDRTRAQHRQEISIRGNATDHRGIRHAGHVSFFERDPFRRVESDGKLIRKQRTDPHSRRRRIGANPDAAGRQIVRSDAAALQIADEMRKRIATEHDDGQQRQRQAP